MISQNTMGLLLIIILYLVMMVAIGLIYSRKNKNVSDFYLGGRKLGPLLPAFVLASITIVVVSLLTPAPSQEIVTEFDNI